MTSKQVGKTEGQVEARTANRSESHLSRQRFLGRTGGVLAAAAAAGALGTGQVPRLVGIGTVEAAAEQAVGRADRAFYIRLSAARDARNRPPVVQLTNGDEALYPATHIANFSKGLPHNSLGEVDAAAYAALVDALAGGRAADFDAIPLGGGVKLAAPQGALAFVLEGPDPQSLAVAAPPAFASAQQAAEMAELYWAALARDVPFSAFGSDPLIAQAAADLSRLSEYRGPHSGGAVTPSTLFRAGMPGDMSGPFISQFLWLPVAYGALHMVQQYPIAPASDHMTTYDQWLQVQQGGYKAPQPSSAPATPAPVRFISTGRDLAAYLHVDFNYQAFLNAALILNKMAAPLDAGNPYVHSKNQAGNTNFGIQHLLDVVAKVANAALKAVWYQKWAVHRRLRPEEFGGRVHNRVTGRAAYPVHGDLLGGSTVLSVIARKYGTYLLPMADPEGSPAHPSYPGAHMAVAGACVAALKAWYDESYVLPEPLVSSADGTSLQPYTGSPLTVGKELDKLAANFAMGRVLEGFHYRTDGLAGLRLGEDVAIGVLADERGLFSERFNGFSLTRFDGTTVTV